MKQCISKGAAGAAIAFAILFPVATYAQAAAATGNAALAPATGGTVAPAPKAKGFTVVEKGAYTRPAPPPPPRPLERSYNVPANAALRHVLQEWASDEGWSVYWPAAADGSEWMTEIAVSFKATDFQQAVTKLIAGLPANAGLAATFNRANSPMLLHVSESSNMQEIP
ncbi:TcpQ domain-containing protein [Stenotrophomonas oahuensis]|uniref:TcpQ domain-containing protein n=1 Tax=Stenotrophomonas oahuensis TaxID=3003271 RepID=A0ABY9YWN4_9GAMM|nr:TcpQ domain-containing protein [Stenotrophomonas sp. A5586]WNH54860.1 TcpQ domain-containing protein [Stenotrophomonas sp. A5586]